MPYIKPYEREEYDKVLDNLIYIWNKGSLEYCVFKLFKIYMKFKPINYANLHDAVYAIIHVGEEIKRRFLDRREDYARKENGDIY